MSASIEPASRPIGFGDQRRDVFVLSGLSARPRRRASTRRSPARAGRMLRRGRWGRRRVTTSGPSATCGAGASSRRWSDNGRRPARAARWRSTSSRTTSVGMVEGGSSADHVCTDSSVAGAGRSTLADRSPVARTLVGRATGGPRHEIPQTHALLSACRGCNSRIHQPGSRHLVCVRRPGSAAWPRMSDGPSTRGRRRFCRSRSYGAAQTCAQRGRLGSRPTCGVAQLSLGLVDGGHQVVPVGPDERRRQIGDP